MSVISLVALLRSTSLTDWLSSRRYFHDEGLKVVSVVRFSLCRDFYKITVLLCFSCICTFVSIFCSKKSRFSFYFLLNLLSGFSWWMQFVILNSEIYFDSKGTCTSWTCKLQLYWSGLASVLENVWKRPSFVFLQTEALLRLMLSVNERGTCCQPKFKRRFPSFPFSLSL